MKVKLLDSTDFCGCQLRPKNQYINTGAFSNQPSKNRVDFPTYKAQCLTVVSLEGKAIIQDGPLFPLWTKSQNIQSFRRCSQIGIGLPTKFWWPHLRLPLQILRILQKFKILNKIYHVTLTNHGCEISERGSYGSTCGNGQGKEIYLCDDGLFCKVGRDSIIKMM